MNVFSGVNGEIVMDYKDYIREKCGDDVFRHIEFYVNFYENILGSYEEYHTKHPDKFIDDSLDEIIDNSELPEKDIETIQDASNFILDIICEL